MRSELERCEQLTTEANRLQEKNEREQVRREMSIDMNSGEDK